MAWNGEPVREEAVNALLAELLGGYGLSARAERRSRGGVPDVRVDLNSGDFLLLECKWESAANTLEAQLEERLEAFPDALGVLGVLYPDRLQRTSETFEELRTTIDVHWWVHGVRGEARTLRPVRVGSVSELADQIRALPLELEGEDRVRAAAAIVDYELERAKDEIAKHARISFRIASLIGETDREKDRAAALRIACLVLFNALAFQDRLSVTRTDVPSVAEVGRRVADLRDAWARICDRIDYVPVFDLAVQIVDILAGWPGEVYGPAFDPLVKAMEGTRHLEGHDLSGRLFHTLLTNAKYTGAYYTSIPAATFLARLVFEGWPRDVDWQDHEFPGSLNVADLACGTGTLLMVVASEVERRHREAGGTNAAALHKAMVEQALHGYDVQLSAIHFAATSLAMLNPEIQFDRMNFYVMPLGVEDGKTSLGSLDFLGVDEVPVQFALSPEVSGDGNGNGTNGPRKVSGSGSVGAGEGVTARLPRLDLAIMNPPFTRSVGGNLLFGSVPKADRRTLQNELASRLKQRKASATAGLGAAFVAAVAPSLHPGEGRLALVLPATVCTGPSWAQTRALIEQEFVLDTVIASHDPFRWNFSDSTDLSEALLIATRRPSNGLAGEHRTTFVNLWRNPESVFDAHRTANAVSQMLPADLEGSGTALLEVDGVHVGELLTIPEASLLGRKWFGMQFARADVTRSALSLLDDHAVRVPGEVTTATVPLCQLGEIGEIGPDQRDVWDGFERTDAVTAYPMVENHDTEKRKYLIAEPDKFLAPLNEPRRGRPLKRLDLLWPKAGRLLIAERLRLNTARMFALWSETNVLSNVWWPVKVDDAQTEKALTLWLNSSLGLLTVLATRTSTEGPWVKLKKADLQELPVLDVRALDDARLAALADLFDELAEAEFARLPDMGACHARGRLDEGLARILGLPALAPLRELLASEPVVSNRRL